MKTVLLAAKNLTVNIRSVISTRWYSSDYQSRNNANLGLSELSAPLIICNLISKIRIG